MSIAVGDRDDRSTRNGPGERAEAERGPAVFTHLRRPAAEWVSPTVMDDLAARPAASPAAASLAAASLAAASLAAASE